MFDFEGIRNGSSIAKLYCELYKGARLALLPHAISARGYTGSAINDHVHDKARKPDAD